MSSAYLRLDDSIRGARNVKIRKAPGETYDFKLYPFGERGTYIEPALIGEITDSLAGAISSHFPSYDYLVSPEPGGHTWGMLASYRLGKPVNILRLSTELYEEYTVRVRRETAYNENYIYFEGFKPGDRVLLLDDVISSGATIRSIADQMRLMDVKLIGVQAILAKGGRYRALETDYGIPVRALREV